MADTFNAKSTISITMNAQHPLDLSTAINSLSFSRSCEWTIGTDAEEADLCFSDQITIQEASDGLIDLKDWTTGWGTAGAFAAVCLLCIENTSVDVTIQLHADDADDWTALVGNASDIILIKPGEIFLKMTTLDAPYAVSVGDQDLHLYNPDVADDVIVNVVIIGQSA